MAFDQTKDVLDHARTFHQQLSVFYGDLKSSTQKDRARALLDYMSSHEQYLDERLEKFEAEVSNNVLDTYFKYGSESTKICEISDFEIKPVMGVDDVIAAAMHFDACLIKFYSEMAQRSLSTKVREVFENLLVMEQHEQFELSKTSLELGAL